MRFLTPIRELPLDLLHEFTHPDYPRSCAPIALADTGGRTERVGVARYAPAKTPGNAEFAVVVADEWQGLGIATHLMRGLLSAAPDAGISTLGALLRHDNTGMLGLAKDLGFRVSPFRKTCACSGW